MAALNVPVVAFNGGEIGKESLARVDIDIYPTCAEVMENCWPRMQGALEKVPGTEYIGRSYLDSTAIVRPFVFNVDQTRVLRISDSRIDIIDGNAQVDIEGFYLLDEAGGMLLTEGGAELLLESSSSVTIGTPADNASSGGSSVAVSGQNVTFICASSGAAAASWEITGGIAGMPTSFRFEIQRRPVSIRVGTTTSAADITLPGGVSELTLDPGVHIISFTPTAATYYIRARLAEQGKAKLVGLTQLAAGNGADGFFIPTPWLAADLPQLRYRQSLDTYWLYHPSYRTRVLERRSNTSWSLRLFRPQDGPFETPNTSTVTLAPAALAGNTTVTASAPMFTSDNIGQLLEITHQGQLETRTFSAVDQATDTVRVFGTGTSRGFYYSVLGTFTATVKLQKSVNEADWLDVATVTSATSGDVAVNDELDNQIIYYRLVCSAYTSGSPVGTITYSGGETTGRCEIVAITSPLEAEVEVYETFGGLTASAIWSQGAWCDAFGWPAAGTIDNGRHCLVRDDRFWASVSDDYESFLLGVDDADAIARRFGTGEMNSARWIESGKRLLIGTSGAETEVFASTQDEPITPLGNRARSFDDNGSADTQAMKVSGMRVAFVDRSRAKLIQCLFDVPGGADTHETDDLTRLHSEIAGLIDEEAGTGGFVEIAFQRKPEPRIWCLRDDGELAVLLFGPKEGVYAWNRITVAETLGGAGSFKSVCVVPGMPEDRVHVMVEREIDGETRMHHERFALQRFPIEEDADGVRTAPEAWRLQAALFSSETTAADTFTGFDHLEGETIAVWGDGRRHRDLTVTDGTITLDYEVQTLIAGLNYQGRWKSAKLAYGAQLGTALTMDKQIGPNLGIIVRDTPAGAVKYGRDFDNCVDVLRGEFPEGMVMDSAVPLENGDYSQPIGGASDIDSRLCIVMDGPAPVTILALIPQIELHERT